MIYCRVNVEATRNGLPIFQSWSNSHLSKKSVDCLDQKDPTDTDFQYDDDDEDSQTSPFPFQPSESLLDLRNLLPWRDLFELVPSDHRKRGLVRRNSPQIHPYHDYSVDQTNLAPSTQSYGKVTLHCDPLGSFNCKNLAASLPNNFGYSALANTTHHASN